MPRPATGRIVTHGGVDPAAAALLPGLHDPGDHGRNLPEPMAKCRALWAAVVAQALSDAMSTAGSWAGQAERVAARRWLLSESRDLHLVIELAGLSVDAWGRAASALRRQWAEVDAGRRPVPSRPPLSAEARAKIAAAVTAHGRERHARRLAEGQAAA